MNTLMAAAAAFGVVAPIWWAVQRQHARNKRHDEQQYAYYHGGKLQRVRVTDPRADVTGRQYDQSDRPTFTW